MIIKGDLNGDGRIDIYDILILNKLVLEEEYTAEQLTAGDIDGDGTLTVGDLLKIRNHVNGITIINEVIY